MAVARSTNLADIEFLSQGYHNNPSIGRAKLQGRIDSLEPGKYDAVLLGYALCNNMLVGIRARDIPVVVPRAHDCITFFMGSKERYASYFRTHPGTYYYTSGWLEYPQRGGERVPNTQVSGLGEQFQDSYEELVAKYGEDNAAYLAEFMGSWVRNYKYGTYIEFDFTSHLGLKERVQQICRDNGWQYDELKGDLGLLQRWVDAQWSEEEFLVVQPGQEVVASYDGGIMAVRAAAPDG